MKKIFFCCLLLLGACRNEQDQKTSIKFDPDSEDYTFDPRNLFSSIRVIPLHAPSDILIDAESDVEYDNDKFFVVETQRRKRVDIFDSNGQYVGSVAARGRGGNEYIGINSFQIIDSIIAIYSYHNKSIYFYHTDGAFVRKESLKYNPLHLLKVENGYWGYSGYSGVVPERVVRMDTEGQIVEKYLPAEGNIIPLSESGAVFTSYDRGVLVRESLRNEITYINENGKIETFLKFDFGKYNIPKTYFDNSDPYAAAEKLMKSDFVVMDRFFINNDYAVLSVNFQKGGNEIKMITSIGIENNNIWKWLKSDPKGSLSMFFSSARQLTSNSELVLIVDADRVKEFSAAYPDLIPRLENSGDNPYIVLCRLK